MEKNQPTIADIAQLAAEDAADIGTQPCDLATATALFESARKAALSGLTRGFADARKAERLLSLNDADSAKQAAKLARGAFAIGNDAARALYQRASNRAADLAPAKGKKPKSASLAQFNKERGYEDVAQRARGALDGFAPVENEGAQA
jgi:hypothetical protein